MKRCSFILMILTFVFALCFPVTVLADMGPKPSLTIEVENAPDELYYLDLLIPGESPESSNLSADDYDEAMLELIRANTPEGWHAGMLDGTGVPMWGDIQSDDDTFRFGYFGVPETYKIIVVTESGAVTVSEEATKDAYQETVTYHYAQSGDSQIDAQPDDVAPPEEPQIEKTPIFLSYLKQFGVTCTMTLVLEGVVLLLFGFRLKENWKPFLLVNVGTQILLTAVTGVILKQHGLINGYLSFIPMEALIFLAEALLYQKFLNGHSPKRRVSYALTANTVSAVCGFLFLHAAWFQAL